jgi:hypothetical protein
MSAHDAWALVCRLFAGGRPVSRGTLSPTEVRACATLGSAIKPTVLNQSHALCPYCHLHSGRIEGNGRGGQVCQCPECGPVSLVAEDRAAIMLDENWMRSKLRIALEIESRDGVTDLGDGVWRLGEARREPVLLARSLERLWAEPSIFDRVRVAGSSTRVIAPKATRMRGAPFAAGIEWLPLEERFTFYGDGIAYFVPGTTPAAVAPADPWTPVFGPFSADFKWATLDDWPHGPIQFTDGQAAVMKALWSFRGVKVSAERVMLKAGQKSTKPNDLFKMKAENIGKPKYEGQLYAYRELVKSTQRPGEYWMPCSSGLSD